MSFHFYKKRVCKIVKDKGGASGMSMLVQILSFFIIALQIAQTEEASSYKPYTSPCVERENIFEFTEKPQVRVVAPDKYEITFSVKAYCDVTVAIVDPSKDITGWGRGFVVRHLGSGVLGPNAPAPFQKNSLKQTIYWNGKDDLDVYVKQPENLKVRVSLGLNPTFDKLLGPTSPKALPGYVLGIAIDNDGVYVFSRGYERGHVNCRKFDHDARYLKTLWPPSSELPPEKLGGMGYIEYEAGKYAVQAPIIDWGLWREGSWMPPTFEGQYGVLQCRPAVFGGRIYLMSSGFNHREFKGQKIFPPKLYFINTDGTTNYEGIRGRIWINSERITSYPHIAISPDGKWLYLVGFQNDHGEQPAHVLLRGPLTISSRSEKKIILSSHRETNVQFQSSEEVWDVMNEFLVLTIDI